MTQHPAHLVLCFLSITIALSSCHRKKDDQQSQLRDSLALARQLTTQQMPEDATPSSIGQDVFFAFSDSSGSYVLGGGFDSLSHGPYCLITSSGETVSLQHMGCRKEREHSTYRQTASNFHNTGGNVFFVDSRLLIPNQTYLVVSNRFLSEHHPLHLIDKDYSPVDSTLTERISHAKARTVHQSWQIASLEKVGQIAIVLFEDNGTNPLASLVVVKSSPFIFEDYVGDVSLKGSVWRVDDGGEFGAKDIKVIAAFQSSDGIELARTWAGTEGENAEFLRQSFNRFVSLMQYYRYWAPE